MGEFPVSFVKLQYHIHENVCMMYPPLIFKKIYRYIIFYLRKTKDKILIRARLTPMKRPVEVVGKHEKVDNTLIFDKKALEIQI